MINWQFFPKSRIIPDHLKNVLSVFELNESEVNSEALIITAVMRYWKMLELT